MRREPFGPPEGMGYGYEGRAEQRPCGHIARTTSRKPGHKADETQHPDDKRPGKDRGGASGAGAEAHASISVSPPLPISAMRRSIAPGRRLNHSSTPVHSTHIVASVSSAQMILRGRPA